MEAERGLRRCKERERGGEREQGGRKSKQQPGRTLIQSIAFLQCEIEGERERERTI